MQECAGPNGLILVLVLLPVDLDFKLGPELVWETLLLVLVWLLIVSNVMLVLVGPNGQILVLALPLVDQVNKPEPAPVWETFQLVQEPIQRS